MKKILVIFAFLIVLSTSGVFAQEVGIINVTQKSNNLEIEIALKNNSSQDILLIAPDVGEPETRYFIFLEKETKTINIRRHFFSYPNNVLDANEPCFGLIRVKTGETYKENISLNYPLAETYIFNNKTDLRNFDSLNFQIGILPYDKFISGIPDSRPFGHCAVSQDEISNGNYKGKNLMEIQNILKSNTVKIN